VTERSSGPASDGKPGVVKCYQDLVVWQRAFLLCTEVYFATKASPQHETFDLTGQMRRAAVSIPSNIAEGFGRRTTADFLRSFSIAYGSTCELQTQVLLAAKLGYLSQEGSTCLLQAVGDTERLTNALVRSLEHKRPKS
jgi:four helix bundle protein